MTLCDYVIVEERTRKVSLIGSFTRVIVPQFPAVAAPFSVFAVLTDGLGSGTIEVRVTRLETDEQVYGYRNTIRFPDQLTEVNCHIRIHQCSFPAPGYYQLTLLIDGEWVAQRRFHVSAREDQS